jgi:hypothetical protein
MWQQYSGSSSPQAKICGGQNGKGVDLPAGTSVSLVRIIPLRLHTHSVIYPLDHIILAIYRMIYYYYYYYHPTTTTTSAAAAAATTAYHYYYYYHHHHHHHYCCCCCCCCRHRLPLLLLLL